MRFVCIRDCFNGRYYKKGEVVEDYDAPPPAEGQKAPDHFVTEDQYQKMLRDKRIKAAR
jgi:hypothetical protein